MGENVGITGETTPDLLKNTAYNIARLADVIDHCKGRHKYLAHTTSPSDGGDVRWYFCKVPLAPNELAASVPRTEIVGKSDYFRFGMRDSLAIEASFLQREEELLSSWWKEYADCSEGPNGRATTSKGSDIEKNGYQDEAQACLADETEEERVGVPVKGGLYEVDLVKRHCFPVYWTGENRRVLRGHWFARKGGLDWLPLREDVSEQLEIAYHNQVWHRRTFQPSGLFAARVDLQGSTPGLHALFTGEDNTWEAWLNVDASGFSSFINVYGKGIKLRRGYSASHSAKPTQDVLRQQKEEEMDDYCSKVPVRHLVFMVHGIGQRLEKSNLVDDVGNFRHITASLAEQHLTLHQRSAQRVLFIPCQWRKGLKLSGETAVEKITLDGVRGLRVMLSATVHDVLYYMSPIYCQDIINSVSNQLNKLYLKFRKRNPGYDGKVSIYGHSLGSVLSYDILCHQENLSSPFPMDWMYKDHASTGEPLPDMNNQLSTANASIHQDANTKVNDQVKEKIDPITEEIWKTQSTVAHQEKNAEDVSTLNSFVSDFDEMSTVANTYEREGTHDVVNYSSEDLLSKDLNHSVEVTEIKSDEQPCCSDSKNKKNDMDTDNTDLTIKLLLKEINTLRAKIANLESESRGDAGENKEALVTIPKQPTGQKLAPILDDVPRSYTPYIKYTKLEFKVDTFFAVGSPLGVFLALRNIRIGIGNGQEYWEEDNISEEMPACRQMFNIFHPFDPVAYRVEPLVCKEYLTKRPVIIPYHRGGKRLHIGFQEFTEDLAAHSHAIMEHLHTVKVKVLTACQSRNADRLEDESENDQEKQERTYGSIMMERLTGSVEGRIDHMLQDKTFEHPYLQAIGSHTNYWRDHDTALFILRGLYRDIPEDPDMLVESCGGESKNDDSSGGWSDRRQTAEEELPLTFSDRMAVRNFSSEARSFVTKR